MTEYVVMGSYADGKEVEVTVTAGCEEEAVRKSLYEVGLQRVKGLKTVTEVSSLTPVQKGEESDLLFQAMSLVATQLQERFSSDYGRAWRHMLQKEREERIYAEMVRMYLCLDKDEQGFYGNQEDTDSTVGLDRIYVYFTTLEEFTNALNGAVAIFVTLMHGGIATKENTPQEETWEITYSTSKEEEVETYTVQQQGNSRQEAIEKLEEKYAGTKVYIRNVKPAHNYDK